MFIAVEHIFGNGADHDMLALSASRSLLTPPCLRQQHNLLGMAAVAQLKTDPKYSAVHELLHIFSVEKLGEYMAFHKVCFGPQSSHDCVDLVVFVAEQRDHLHLESANTASVHGAGVWKGKERYMSA